MIDNSNTDKGTATFRPWFAGIQTGLLVLMSLAFLITSLFSFAEYYGYTNTFMDYEKFSYIVTIIFGAIFCAWLLIIFLDAVFGSTENVIAKVIGTSGNSKFLQNNLKDYYSRTYSSFSFYFFMHFIKPFLN